MEASIRAKVEELNFYKDTVANVGLRIQTYRGQMLSLIALLIAISALSLQPIIQKNSAVNSVTSSLSERFPIIIMFLFIAVYFVYIAMGAGNWNYKSRIFPFIKDFTIISLSHKKSIGSAMIALSILLIVLAWDIISKHGL